MARYERHIERWYPLTIAVVVGATAYWASYRTRFDLDQVTDSLFSNTVNLGGITIGFLAAAKSILFSMEDSFIIRQFREAKAYKKLVNYFMDAINLGFLLVILSIIGSLINFGNPARWHYIFFGSWSFLLVATGLSAYRVIKLFSDTLKDS